MAKRVKKMEGRKRWRHGEARSRKERGKGRKEKNKGEEEGGRCAATLCLPSLDRFFQERGLPAFSHSEEYL